MEPRQVGLEQAARHPGGDARGRDRHGVDRAARRPEGERGADPEQVDVPHPGRPPGEALAEGTVLVQIGEGAEPLIRLLRRRGVVVPPGGDIVGAGRQLRHRRRVHPRPGAADQVVGREIPPRGRHLRPRAFRPGIGPRAADMHGEIRKGENPAVGILREAFPQAEDVGHEAPAPFIRHLVQVPEEAGEGQPAIGLDDHGLRPPAEQVHLRRPGFQRRRRIVEGRGPGAEHRHHLPAQRGEVDLLRRMGAERQGQGLDKFRHPPAPGALLAGGQHHLPRQHPSLAGLDRQAGQAVIRPARGDGAGRNAVADRYAGDPAEPQQVVVPVFLRNPAHRLEMGGAELGLVPGLVGQRRQLQIRADLGFPGPKGAHPSIGDPGTLPPIGGAVHHQDVVHPVPLQRMRHRHAALPGADDQAIQHRRALAGLGLEPGRPRMGGQLQVAGDILFQLGERPRCGHGLLLLHRKITPNPRPATIIRR